MRYRQPDSKSRAVSQTEALRRRRSYLQLGTRNILTRQAGGQTRWDGDRTRGGTGRRCRAHVGAPYSEVADGGLMTFRQGTPAARKESTRLQQITSAVTRRWTAVGHRRLTLTDEVEPVIASVWTLTGRGLPLSLKSIVSRSQFRCRGAGMGGEQMPANRELQAQLSKMQAALSAPVLCTSSEWPEGMGAPCASDR